MIHDPEDEHLTPIDWAGLKLSSALEELEYAIEEFNRRLGLFQKFEMPASARSRLMKAVRPISDDRPDFHTLEVSEAIYAARQAANACT